MCSQLVYIFSCGHTYKWLVVHCVKDKPRCQEIIRFDEDCDNSCMACFRAEASSRKLKASDRRDI